MKKSLVYTRTGDAGTTSLVDGTRVAKSHPRLQAYGTIDELNSHLGLLRAIQGADHPQDPTLQRVQNLMFNIGGYLASPAADTPAAPHGLTPDHITHLEQQIDTLDSQLTPLRQFVLPAGTQAACQAHVSRAVCRRAERAIITLQQAEQVDPIVVRYVNRLSDYLFILARFNNQQAHQPELFWTKDC